MEGACAMQLAFQQSGAAFHPITDEVVSAAYNRPTGGRNEPAKFEWPALLRKLDRIDQSYKQETGDEPAAPLCAVGGQGRQVFVLKNSTARCARIKVTQGGVAALRLQIYGRVIPPRGGEAG